MREFKALALFAVILLGFVTFMAIKGETLGYSDTGVVSCKVTNLSLQEEEKNDTAFVNVGKCSAPVLFKHNTTNYLVDVKYKGKDYRVRDKDLYERVVVGDNVNLHIFKKDEQVKLIYKD